MSAWCRCLPRSILVQSPPYHGGNRCARCVARRPRPKKKTFAGQLFADNVVNVPLSPLRTLLHGPTLVREFWLAAVAGDLLEEDGLPGRAGALALASLFALPLLEFLFDRRGARKLLRVDGVGDAAPERKRFVLLLQVLGRDDLGGDVERGQLNDGEARLGGLRLLADKLEMTRCM